MDYLPERDKDASYVAISQDEYANFVKETIQLVVKQKIQELICNTVYNIESCGLKCLKSKMNFI